MKIENLKPGQTVYQTRSYTLGNTTMRTVGVWEIVIKEVHLEDPNRPYVVASWNTNRAEKFYIRSVKTWKKEKPVLVGRQGGPQHLATREEKKSIKETIKARAASQTEGYFNLITKGDVTLEPVTREEALERMDKEGM